MSVLRILHVEDNELDAELVRQSLEDGNLECVVNRVSTRAAYEMELRSAAYDLILSDFSMPGFDGLSALQMARSAKPDLPFIFVSGTIGEERAVESLKNGAVDYVLKDRLSRLVSVITRARNEAKARAEIRQNTELLRRQAQLLNEARDAIFVRNLNQVVTYWNKGAERIYGWTAAEILGRNASELLYKSDAPTRENIWEAVLTNGEWQGELGQVTKDGKEICVASRRTLLRDAAGRPSAILNINTDITEKKALEAQLYRSQRMDSIGALASGVAHDLNNVLAPILMAAELLRDQQPDAECVRMLDIAKSSARRGADLVKQILQFARGTQRGEQLIDLKAIIDEIARFASKTFPPIIRITTSAESNLTVFGDATQLHQVLLNLCVNARDAMPRGGTLMIEARRVHLKDRVFPAHATPVSGTYVELSVCDSGEGISPEIINKIFDPFFTTKAEGNGTGLGLSTVRSITRNHQGFLELGSAVGEGTTFRLYFPAADTKAALPVSEIAEDLDGNGEAILLIDDEAGLLEMTRQLLETYNYKVFTARDGVEGWAMFDANRNSIKAVITDLLMPGMGGRELIRLIRESVPRTLIVCLSGSTDNCATEPEDFGANVLLRKPCPTNELLRALSQLRHIHNKV